MSDSTELSVQLANIDKLLDELVTKRQQLLHQIPGMPPTDTAPHLLPLSALLPTDIQHGQMVLQTEQTIEGMHADAT